MDRAQRASLPATVTTTLASSYTLPTSGYCYTVLQKTFAPLYYGWAASKQPLALLLSLVLFALRDKVMNMDISRAWKKTNFKYIWKLCTFV